MNYPYIAWHIDNFPGNVNRKNAEPWMEKKVPVKLGIYSEWIKSKTRTKTVQRN